MSPDARDPRRSASQAIRVGVIVLAVGAVLTLVPLVLDLRSVNRFLVAFGLIAVLVGLGCLTNGLIDLVRDRTR
jgi:hypothetical protein